MGRVLLVALAVLDALDVTGTVRLVRAAVRRELAEVDASVQLAAARWAEL